LVAVEQGLSPEVEAEQMNRGLSFVMTSTLGMAVGFLMGQTPRKAGAEVEAARSIDAAFYDGEFQAQLDAENGRKPHIQSGRWITDGDRVLFIAAYWMESYTAKRCNRFE
jgi:hypothetical protein